MPVARCPTTPPRYLRLLFFPLPPPGSELPSLRPADDTSPRFALPAPSAGRRRRVEAQQRRWGPPQLRPSRPPLPHDAATPPGCAAAPAQRRPGSDSDDIPATTILSWSALRSCCDPVLSFPASS